MVTKMVHSFLNAVCLYKNKNSCFDINLTDLFIMPSIWLALAVASSDGFISLVHHTQDINVSTTICVNASRHLDIVHGNSESLPMKQMVWKNLVNFLGASGRPSVVWLKLTNHALFVKFAKIFPCVVTSMKDRGSILNSINTQLAVLSNGHVRPCNKAVTKVMVM